MVLMEDDDPDRAQPHRRLHPMVKLSIGLLVGGAVVWLVLSIAGGVGDARRRRNR